MPATHGLPGGRQRASPEQGRGLSCRCHPPAHPHRPAELLQPPPDHGPGPGAPGQPLQGPDGGEGPGSLLGSLLVSSLSLAGLSRTELAEDERQPFFAYLDEFQTFGTLSLATTLSELRKYRVGMALGNQYLGQLDHELRDAVLGNIGTLVAFRVDPQDAPMIARELAPKFEPEDLISLPNHHIYLGLLIDGEPSKPFSAETLPWTAVD